MGLELAKAYVRVQGDSSGMPAFLDDTKKQVDNTMRDIAISAAAILGGFAAFGQGVIRQGMAAAANFEMTTVEMETMLGTAEETKKTLDDLTAFAVATPFEMPQLLQVTQGLIQFGERGDELMETIKILGDASGGTAQKFQILGLVFNQIRGVGHLLTGDFRQLSTRGIISLQDIAKHYGVTTAAAQNMLSSGKVSFKDFRAILKGLTEEGGRFANMMIKQSTTMEGLTSTMKDSFNIMKRILVTPLMPWAKGIVQAFIQFGAALEYVVRQGGPAISFAFAGATAFGTLGASIAGVIIVGRLLGMTLKSFLIGSGIGIAVLALGAAFGGLVGWLQSLKGVQESAGKGWAVLTGAVQYFVDLFKDLGNVEWFAAMWLEQGQLVEDIISNIVRNFEVFAEEAWAAIQWLTGGMVFDFESMAATVMSFVTTALGYIEFFTTDFYLTFQLIAAYVNIAMVQGSNYFVTGLNLMMAAAAGFVMATISVFLDLAANLMIIFEWIWAGVSGVFMAMISIGLDCATNIYQFFANGLHNINVLWEYLAVFVIGSLKAIVTFVGSAANNIWEFFANAGSNIQYSFDVVRAAIAGTAAAIWVSMKNSAKNIGLEFQLAIAAIKGMFVGLWEGIKSKFKGGTFAEGFSDAYNKELLKVKGEFVTEDPAAAYKKEMDKVKGEMKGNFKDPIGDATAVFDAEMAKIKGKFKGDFVSIGQMSTTAADVFKQQFAGLDSLFVPGQNAAEIFLKTFEDWKGPTNPLGAWLTQADEVKNKLIEEIKFQQEVDKMLSYKPNKPKPEKEKPGKKPKPDMSVPGVGLEAGRYGFLAMGTKIQDAVLGKNKDHGAETVDVLKSSQEIQEKQLKATETLGKNGGLGP